MNVSGWLESLVETYGTLAVFFGTSIEGEAVAIAGGVMAHREHLSLSGLWPWQPPREVICQIS